MAPNDAMAQTHRRTFYRVASLTLLTAVSLLSGCATNFDSAGNTYYSFWPFIGSRNPELQLNFPAQNPKSLQLGQDPDPFYLISPQPPVDPRVTSPFSQAPADPDARVAGVGDNAGCADSCESKEAISRAIRQAGALPALRADAGDSRSAD
jgi:hypothetical protein